MFQVEKPTLTARLSAGDQPVVNDFLKQYQAHYNVTFTTYKDFLMHVVSNASLLAPKVSEDDAILVNTIIEQVKTFSDNNQLPKTMAVKEVVNLALTSGVLIPSEMMEAVEAYAIRENVSEDATPFDVVVQALTAEPKSVEVEKPVPVKLEENQLLLTLSKSRNKCLQEIHANRAEVLKEQESAPQTIEETALGLMFNAATLGNWSRQYFTGRE